MIAIYLILFISVFIFANWSESKLFSTCTAPIFMFKRILMSTPARVWQFRRHVGVTMLSKEDIALVTKSLSLPTYCNCFHKHFSCAWCLFNPRNKNPCIFFVQREFLPCILPISWQARKRELSRNYFMQAIFLQGPFPLKNHQ